MRRIIAILIVFACMFVFSSTADARCCRQPVRRAICAVLKVQPVKKTVRFVKARKPVKRAICRLRCR